MAFSKRGIYDLTKYVSGTKVNSIKNQINSPFGSVHPFRLGADAYRRTNAAQHGMEVLHNLSWYDDKAFQEQVAHNSRPYSHVRNDLEMGM